MFPYDGIADFQNWLKAVGALAADQIDPQAGARFPIAPDSCVASAGSCFAGQIAESLREYGFNYYLAEPGAPWLTPQQRTDYSYGTFSARYGNIYTTPQLLRTIKPAIGTFTPCEDFWRGKNGEFLDPFRPSIQPGGFTTLEELHADRAQHLDAVKRMLAEIDVFVFTLGLTEGFSDRRDDAAFPQCPGRGIGEVDPGSYYCRNLTVSENVAYMQEAIGVLRTVNPNLQIILTVSPIPLAATIEPRHALASTTYSKCVLREVADEMQRAYTFVDYFASYEIIVATFNNTDYFNDDRRNVAAGGIDHVMWSCYRNYLVRR